MIIMETEKGFLKPLLGLTIDELRQVALNLGMPSFAGKQMAEWIYRHHVGQIDDMTNLSQKNRLRLKEQYEIGAQKPLETMRSIDGTIKYLFPVANGKCVETVFIPDGDRATLCVSCQVGCKMGCRFCMTGAQKFHGNLTTTEILNQIYALPEHDRLTNIVFMGQGEPMDNLDPILKVLDILTATYGYAWSPKRITVSTVGVKGQVERFLKETQCHLAVSLHNPFPDEREKMMPAEHAYSIKDLISLLKQQDWSHQRRLSFEYIVFDGLNDSEAHIKELVRMLSGLECRINLIHFHTIPDSPFKGSTDEKMVLMRDYLTNHGITTTIRASRGQDIYAACGLLSTKNKQQNQQN